MRHRTVYMIIYLLCKGGKKSIFMYLYIKISGRIQRNQYWLLESRMGGEDWVGLR